MSGKLLSHTLAARHGGSPGRWASLLRKAGLPSNRPENRLSGPQRQTLRELVAAHSPDKDGPAEHSIPPSDATTLSEWGHRCLHTYLIYQEPWRLVPPARQYRASMRHRDRLLHLRVEPVAPEEPRLTEAVVGELGGPEELKLAPKTLRTYALLVALSRDVGLRRRLFDLAPYARGTEYFPARLVARIANPVSPSVSAAHVLPTALVDVKRTAGVDYWRLARDSVAPTDSKSSAPAHHNVHPIKGVLERLAPLPADRPPLALTGVTEEGLAHVAARYRHRDLQMLGSRQQAGLFTLFAGPAGHGRRTAARLLCDDLGVELYRLRPGGVVSKYVGETEQRISAVFEAVAQSGGALLIEDAHDLFAPRTAVRHTSDRRANMMSNHLLQCVDQFEGFCILTGTRINAFEAAMRRRIATTVVFRQADREARAEVLCSTIAWLRERFRGEVPKPIDVDELGRISDNISPAELVRTVLDAAMACQIRKTPFTTDVLIAALKARVERAGGVVGLRPKKPLAHGVRIA